MSFYSIGEYNKQKKLKRAKFENNVNGHIVNLQKQPPKGVL